MRRCLDLWGQSPLLVIFSHIGTDNPAAPPSCVLYLIFCGIIGCEYCLRRKCSLMQPAFRPLPPRLYLSTQPRRPILISGRLVMDTSLEALGIPGLDPIFGFVQIGHRTLKPSKIQSSRQCGVTMPWSNPEVCYRQDI